MVFGGAERASAGPQEEDEKLPVISRAETPIAFKEAGAKSTYGPRLLVAVRREATFHLRLLLEKASPFPT